MSNSNSNTEEVGGRSEQVLVRDQRDGRAWVDANPRSSLRGWAQMTTLSRCDALAWGVLEILGELLGASGDLLAVCGTSCRRRVGRPGNSVHKWRHSRILSQFAARRDFGVWGILEILQATTLSLFSARRDAEAWNQSNRQPPVKTWHARPYGRCAPGILRCVATEQHTQQR